MLTDSLPHSLSHIFTHSYSLTDRLSLSHSLTLSHIQLNKRKVNKLDEIPEGYDPDLSARFKRWADEAEREENYLVAERYHKERINLKPDRVPFWYDYALFCLRAVDLDKAEAALKECLALDITNCQRSSLL